MKESARLSSTHAVHFCRFMATGLMLLLLPLVVSGQKLVLDSLILQIHIPEPIFQTLNIDTVMDWRGTDSRFAAFDEATRYGFIPVDQVVLLDRPLPDLVRGMFHGDSSGADPGFGLAVEHFDLSCSKPFPFFRRYGLSASVMILCRSGEDSLVPRGSLVFDSGKIRRKKSGIETNYKLLIENWLYALPEEVNSACRALKTASDMPYHYRIYNSKSVWTRLNAEAEWIVTTGGWMMDGQMYFSYPQPYRSFSENQPLIRFRSQKKMDSIEWGIFNYSRHYRLNPSWKTVLRTNALFGINRWKDMKTVNHKIYDAMIADFSVIESLRYHPMDARTLTLGFGMNQDLYYVHSKGLKFQAGITVQIGVQI